MEGLHRTSRPGNDSSGQVTLIVNSGSDIEAQVQHHGSSGGMYPGYMQAHDDETLRAASGHNSYHMHGEQLLDSGVPGRSSYHTHEDDEPLGGSGRMRASYHMHEDDEHPLGGSGRMRSSYHMHEDDEQPLGGSGRMRNSYHVHDEDMVPETALGRAADEYGQETYEGVDATEQYGNGNSDPVKEVQHVTFDDHGQPARKPTGRPIRNRKRGDKKPFLKSWLCITSNGEVSVLQADKYKLTAQLGIQTRDLRLLDPNMATTYPSAILCRDKSIVVNLEHIKVIITTDRVLVVNHEDERTTKFVQELKQRIARPTMAASKSFPSAGDLQRAAAAAPLLGVKTAGGNGLGGANGLGNGNGFGGAALGALALSAQLPFELRVLEICLDELASEYDLQTTELEAAAYPALDTLAARVTSPHLERVRRLKNRLVRLTTRVETVREVLERFLDDDEDMHDLNLTANLEVEEADGTEVEGGSGGVITPHAKRVSTRSLVSSVSTNSSVMESEVAEVEMLLEAYFMHFDNTYNRLTTLSEYIKDTEDLVNIKLDQHRNQLITTDLILTAFTCSMAVVTTIAGIFGMNLNSGLADAEGVFNQVTIASCVGAICMFTGFVVFAWRYGLLVFD